MNNTNYDPNNEVQSEQNQQPGYQQPNYQQPNYQQPNYQHPGYQQPQYQYPQQTNSNAGKGQSVAALVLGIVSATFSLILSAAFPVNIIFFVCGIVGIVFGVQGRKKSIEANGKASGLATAGFVLSIIGTVFSGLFVVSCLACAACYGAEFSALFSLLN